MESLFFLLLISAALFYWYGSQQCKVYAVRYAIRECDRQGVQLLDQTVQQTKISMSRDEQGRWRVWRAYRFEYSHDGVDRYEGRLVLLGFKLLRSALETSDPIIH